MEKRNQKTIRLKNKTASSFGFEWNKFDDIYGEYEDNFLSYIAPVDKEFFKGKTILDAGCGAGRHTYFAAKWGAKRVVGSDIGKGAVDAALENTKGLGNVSIAWADIYNLPRFWEEAFDIVMCIGVAQHLPDPQAGFDKLVKMLKPGGTMLLWTYGRKDNWMAINLYEPVRKTTTKIPHKVLYWMTLPIAVGIEILNRAKAPLFQHYRRFPFRTKWNDTFDILSAPKSRYYRLWEIRKWFKDAGLKCAKVEYRMLNGKAKGIKGMGTK